MNVVVEEDVLDRLEAIERDEGIPVERQIRQAVAVWSHLEGSDERRIAGLAVMRIVVAREMRR
ncbi:hypothetical protein [Aureimonas jatrophae]|uniref:Ribbon-helix-helix protein, copG family n=1 Tax=Aureimonas jatrophae TaxID=1166073 RepID=A0A1H0M519_9HYPH|nr:hypothetical protein [Aureimonas jatrophae]MBB3952618.1 hypothetical protein [Aureimonas jatrophae]SDO75592.1 hypothetical protein SAMN05192530_11274 [Aureimonas jatrophae]